MPAAARPVHRGVAVDANGADLGPAEVAAGARLAAAAGVRVLLFGPAGELGESGGGVEVIDAPVSIAKQPDPVRAVRSTPDASIVQAARAVGSGQADALVCSGSTGAALAACLFYVKRGRGIHRPALAVPVPVPGHPVTLLDVGANAEARLEHLVQFAYMGAAFANAVLGIDRPRVGLLSNGGEQGRGSQLLIDVHAVLSERMAAGGGGGLVFVGNVEGDGLVQGAADVVVTDGLTGNIALKLIEGVSGVMLGAVRSAAGSSRRATLGGLLLRPALRGFRDSIDPEAQGGAYLLGLRRLGVVAHGRFGRDGVAAAIVRAARGIDEDVVGKTFAALDAAGALRRGAPAPASADRAPAPTSGDGATVPGHDD